MNTELEPDNPKPAFSFQDWFLQSLVDKVNRLPYFDFDITLQVGGMLVSGFLVSGDKYFEGFAQEFTSSISNNELADALRKMFTEYGDIYHRNDTSEAALPLPNYIHLKNARFFHINGNPIPTNKGVWWRGRISEVSGFVLGGLSVEKY